VLAEELFVSGNTVKTQAISIYPQARGQLPRSGRGRGPALGLLEQ